MNNKAMLFEIKYALSLKIHSHLSFKSEMNAHIWATSLSLRGKEKNYFSSFLSPKYMKILI